MAAYHDETVFDRAEQFDIFRDDLKIAPAWGRGIHMCVGRVLAHMDGEIALDTLLDRIPDLDLVCDVGRSSTPQLMMPTFRPLYVRWSLGRASCRASVCPYVLISLLAISLKTKILHSNFSYL